MKSRKVEPKASSLCAKDSVTVNLVMLNPRLPQLKSLLSLETTDVKHCSVFMSGNKSCKLVGFFSVSLKMSSIYMSLCFQSQHKCMNNFQLFDCVDQLIIDLPDLYQVYRG